jgi:membrane protease YdiL (CAAX protease family)
MIPDNNSYPSLPQAWFIFAIFLAVSIGTGLLLSAINAGFGIQNLSVGNFFGYNISLLFVIWFAWRYRKTTGDPRLYYNRVPGLLLPVLVILTLAFAIFLDPLTNLIPMPEIVEEMLAMLATRDLWTFTMVGITGPILEEVLFRGIILDGFLKRYNPKKAIFWSAFLFGLFHLNPWQFIPGFLIGLLLGYIYLKTRSLIPVILVHMVNNSFSYLVMYIYGADVNSFVDIFTDKGEYYLFFGGSTALALLSLLLMFRILKRNPLIWTYNSKTGSSSLQEPAPDSDAQ